MRQLRWVVVAMLLASITVDATTFTIQWAPPTQYEDGTALLEQDLDFYSLYCDDNHLLDLDSIVGTWTAEITFVEPGTYRCNLTVTDMNGEESQFSNEKVFIKGPRVPQSPTLL